MIARKKADTATGETVVTMLRRKQPPQILRTRALAYHDGDLRSLWLLAPADVRAAMSRMLESGGTVAKQLQTRRGVVTGANAALIIARVQPRLGDLALVHSEGEYEAHIEESVLRPLVRGCDIGAWRTDIRHSVIYSHRDDNGGYVVPPRRTLRYLREHGVVDRRGRVGALQHAGGGIDCTRIAWHDLANNLKAVVLPSRMTYLGGCRAIVPLNTVYYIAAADPDAHVLAAYFNSLPLRVFARAIAERAKDAHFRFFACTVALLPLPLQWRTTEAGRLRSLSHGAHASGVISEDAQRELDEIVGHAYGLTAGAMNALQRFDHWLRGES